jgi:predicted ATPase
VGTASSLVGRAAERSAARAALREDRLTTLVGPGGVGKTRLAIAVASEASPAYPSGCPSADLTSVRPDFLAEALSAALGVTERPGQPLEQALHELLSQGRRLLVVDGCGHGDALSSLLGRLLAGCPELAVLATGREPLGAAGERTVTVPPLAGPEAAALFLDRAGEAGAGADRGLVDVLCSRLGGMPLAIELVAAHAGPLGLDGLRRELPESYGSVEDVVDWSWARLDEPERRLLRRLAVFVRGFDLDAAGRVGTGGDPGAAAGTVRLLAGRGLLAPEPGAPLDRWRMPGSVRTRALDRLAASGEEPDARRLHLEWAVAEAVELERLVGADQPWRPRFDLVADDLREALEGAAGPRRATHRLARTLAHLCYARRFLLEARQHYRHAGAHAPDDATAAVDLRAGADVSMAQHLGEPAFELLMGSAQLARSAGDDAAQAIALTSAVCIGNRCPATFTDEVPHERLSRLLDEARRVAPAGHAVAGAYLAAAEAWNATGVKTIPDHELAWAALRAARAADDPVLIVAALDAVIMGEAGAGRFREAQRLGRERIEQFHRLVRHDPRTGIEIIDTLHVGPLVAMAAGDLAGAVAAAQLASDDPFSGLYMRASKHVVPLTLCGRFDEALGFATTMWEGWQRVGRPAARWMAPAVHAAALISGLRGRADEHDEWLDRADRMAAPRGQGHISDSFAAFADPRLHLHTGAIEGALAAAVDLSLTPPWYGAVHQYFDACSWAVAAEVAVVAGLPDAAERLAVAAPAGAESAWAAACLLRAGGRLHGDQRALRESLEAWKRIGARFERACTMVLLPDRAAEGLGELSSLGCRQPAQASAQL